MVKYLGAAYLIYMGLRTLLFEKKGQQASIAAPRSLWQLFSKGFLVSLLNPKAALFFYAFLPQFVDPAKGAVTGQIFFFGTLFVLLASCTDSLYAALGSFVGKLLIRSQRFQHIQRYITGSIYIALGLTTAVTGVERK